jgi:hypothetical protein
MAADSHELIRRASEILNRSQAGVRTKAVVPAPKPPTEAERERALWRAVPLAFWLEPDRWDGETYQWRDL